MQHLLSLIVGCMLIGLNEGQQPVGIFDDEDILKIIRVHNSLRLEADPPATSMNFITWSYGLQMLATLDLEKASNSHEQNTRRSYMGPAQNTYTGPHLNIEDIVRESWFNEGRNGMANATVCRHGCNCSNYINIMSSAAFEIGCAYLYRIDRFLSKRDAYVFHCRYSHSNDGAPPYKAGPVCSECPPDRPFCLYDLCISNKMAADRKTLDIYPMARSHLSCRLTCKVCFKLVATQNECRCECSSLSKATGGICKNQASSPSLNTSLVGDSVCMNGGKTSGDADCSCSCPVGFSGRLCEFDENERNSSIGITLILKKYSTLRKAEFFTNVWSQLRVTIASIVSSYCRSDLSKLVRCCPMESNVTLSSGNINETQVKLNETGVVKIVGINITSYFTVSVETTKSTLCTAIASNNRSQYIPAEELLAAVTASKAKISQQLDTCCPGVHLHIINNTSYETIAPWMNTTRNYSTESCEATYKNSVSQTTPIVQIKPWAIVLFYFLYSF